MMMRAMVLMFAAVMIAAVVSGCANQRGRNGAVVERGAPPSYAEAAAAYNERIAPLGRFRAQATVQFRYETQDGDERVEQPEGTIQIVRPDRLALSLGKLGQVKFWLGSDEERYWWIDMLRDEPEAYVGRHDAFTKETERRLVLTLTPRSLIRVLCLTPMDVGAAGATQWSSDGLRLGIVTPLEGGGRQRVWVDPDNFSPVKSELYDAAGGLAFVVQMSGDERVEVATGSVRGGSPWIPKSYSVFRPGEMEPVARISLSGAKNSGVSDKAFEFETVVETYGVEVVRDVDRVRE